MNQNIQKQNYSANIEFCNGIACGVAITTGIAGLYDYISDESIDHPLLIGIPFLASIVSGFYIKIKHGLYSGRKDLERELE